jgi:predicted  nucleic acid-binding Zn-ribbon protein
MSFVDMPSLGWEIAAVMGLYTIGRNYFQDSKAVREKKEKAFADAVSKISSLETRLDLADRQLTMLADIVKKYADLNVLVASMASNVKALESGLADVKVSYRDLNKNITDFFKEHRRSH